MPETVIEAAAALAAGRTSAVALVEDALARIADPAGEGGRAFMMVHGDAARATAAAMDSLRKAGRAPSPYAGIPISVKDLYDEAGVTSRSGSVVLNGAAPAKADAPTVQRLRRAAGEGGCTKRAAVAPRRLCRDWAHQYGGIRLFRTWRESALRHAKKPLGSRNGPLARWVFFRRRCGGGGWHGLYRAWHRYGRFLPHSGCALRCCWLEAHGKACADYGHFAAIAFP